MNILLPYPDLEESAYCLDWRRRNKQMVENDQIIISHGNPNYPWANHPCSKMWKGYDLMIVDYSYYLNRVYTNDYKKPDHKSFVKTSLFLINLPLEIQKLYIYSTYELPPFFGNDEYHAIHRSRLLFKGEVDALVDVISSHYSCKYSQWRKYNLWDLPTQINAISYDQREQMKRFADYHNLEYVNFYRQYNWNEPDNLINKWEW